MTNTGAHSDSYTMLRHFLLDPGVEPSLLAKGAIPKPPEENTVQEKGEQLAPAASGLRAAMIERHKSSELLGLSAEDTLEAVLTALTQESKKQAPGKGSRRQIIVEEVHTFAVALNYEE